MKLINTKLDISFENGKIVRVATKANLDTIYSNLIKKAKRRLLKNSTSVPDGVKLIIFGSFYLEAIINERLINFLHSEFAKSPVVDLIWETLKSSNIYTKSSILSRGVVREQKKYDDNTKKLKSLFELRNRLAHFKDSDFVWPDPIPEVTADNIEPLISLFNALDNPQLIQELTGTRILSRITELDDLMAWAESLQKNTTPPKNLRRLR